jgi:aspartate/methionine/tyrosine aminotransferase
MINNIPIPREIIDNIAAKSGISAPGRASIREIVNLTNQVEKETGIRFIRMEMGVPGLKPPEIATQAEIEALNQGVAAIYPPIEGVAGCGYQC